MLHARARSCCSVLASIGEFSGKCSGKSRRAGRVSARLGRRRAVVERCEPVARGVVSRGSGVRQPFEALASALAGHTELGSDDPPRGTLPMSA